MKIYLINARKILSGTKVVIVVSALALISALLFGIVASSYNSEGDGAAVNAGVNKVIIIDPGHGGEDSGAIGVSGRLEKDLNLEMALLIGEELAQKGFTVVYTRTEDKMLYSPEENIKGIRKISDLKNRCAKSFEYEDPIFVSVHMNSYGSSKYSGLQVYYTPNSDQSTSLARSIQSTVHQKVQNDNKRQIKKGSNLYLLENCNGTAVLIECGFLSNLAECEKLSEKEYQKELSFAIVCGIIDYVEQNNAS